MKKHHWIHEPYPPMMVLVNHHGWRQMAVTHNLGFPRAGAQRELKKALEAYWSGEIDQSTLREVGRELRERHWLLQARLGVDWVPVGDFAFYDQVLNTTALLGAVPPRFGATQEMNLDLYFAMARGTAQQPAMEMTKWFDTNYHYLVPEFTAATEFRLSFSQLFDEVEEANALGVNSKAVVLGPVSYLFLGKEKAPGFDRLTLLPKLLPLYREMLQRLRTQKVQWVQIDEPVLAVDLPEPWLAALQSTYIALAQDTPKLLLTTYFGAVDEHADLLKGLPVAGLHLDLVRAPQQLDAFLDGYPDDKVLSLGIVDGRNIWRNDLAKSLGPLAKAHDRLGGRLWIAPSCSLLHSPMDLDRETELDSELKDWLAFAVQKLGEVASLRRALLQGIAAIAEELAAAARAQQSRAASSRIHHAQTQYRLQTVAERDAQRQSPYASRRMKQRALLRLPLLPTTTIGSFPQTAQIRRLRGELKHGKLSVAGYREAMRAEIADAIQRQEEIGLDVLVHGEPERNDMVEYFGEQLAGFAFTANGWIQSYGSRCVKPPIIFGDVSRPGPMTVEWTSYAQSLTAKPVKGMLTGPITLLQWSFVRDDQPRAATCRQIALAIRDEVADLERAGVRIIQIDEPAFREGLPLKRVQWNDYFEWAAHAFRLASCDVADETQIHTHMCYSEFNDILPAIAALDADVITIETSRSDMELLRAFGSFDYPNEIGPGVYDIHSPRVPAQEEMVRLIDKAIEVIDPERLWVNPDCGLKTRRWPEVEAALRRMVGAAREIRHRLR
jgi:5-methyltetrahydropteroyltriglutamate--homocysteine methyltransferase